MDTKIYNYDYGVIFPQPLYLPSSREGNWKDVYGMLFDRLSIIQRYDRPHMRHLTPTQVIDMYVGYLHAMNNFFKNGNTMKNENWVTQWKNRFTVDYKLSHMLASVQDLDYEVQLYEEPIDIKTNETIAAWIISPKLVERMKSETPL